MLKKFGMALSVFVLISALVFVGCGGGDTPEGGGGADYYFGDNVVYAFVWGNIIS